MTVMSERTLGEIAAEFPAAAPVFEKYRIDYCCRGRRRFLETCRQAGLNPADIEAEIAAASRFAAPPALDWNTASLQALASHIIEVDHPALGRELAALNDLVPADASSGLPNRADKLRELRRTLVRLMQEMNGHMHREDTVLLTAIVRLDAAR
jgi:regulator of cell morphogenesis and NO signaling